MSTPRLKIITVCLPPKRSIFWTIWFLSLQKNHIKLWGIWTSRSLDPLDNSAREHCIYICVENSVVYWLLITWGANFRNFSVRNKVFDMQTNNPLLPLISMISVIDGSDNRSIPRKDRKFRPISNLTTGLFKRLDILLVWLACHDSGLHYGRAGLEMCFKQQCLFIGRVNATSTW